MGYRAFLEAEPETVQDLELAARRRLDEAMTCILTSGRTRQSTWRGWPQRCTSKPPVSSWKEPGRPIQSLSTSLR